jgi:6,7-dimethyl-8-ribityllumazine synthase
MATSKTKSTLPKNAAQGKRFAIVAARYHEDLIQKLLAGATKTLESLGAKPADISTVWVPGSFEIPFAAHAVAQHQKVDAIICLGVIIKGETKHDQYIASEVARGISSVGHASGIPTIFGVLTTETEEQAKARTGGVHGHKGVEAAEAAVSMIHVLEQIKGSEKKPSGNVGFGFNT